MAIVLRNGEFGNSNLRVYIILSLGVANAGSCVIKKTCASVMRIYHVANDMNWEQTEKDVTRIKI